MDLTGKLLVAMPGMGDPRFEHSVVFICAYSPEGAMGLIVNKPAPDLKLSDILDQLEITKSDAAGCLPIYFGGPVETARGFVLHTDDYASRLQSLEIEGGYGMTATLDVLEDIANGSGPQKALVTLGYAGWGPGQLDGEIARNGWLTVEPASDLIFDAPNEKKWMAALDTLGIDPLGLSAAAGRA
ncbi:MAG: YqgE/AlgH family protein [Pseudomonadota bacterium]